MNPRMKILVAAILFAVPCGAAKFDDAAEEPRWSWLKVSGLLDLRAAHTDRPASWFDDGHGRLRHGGSGTSRRAEVSIPQASLVLEAKPHANLKAHVQANVTTQEPSGSNKAGVIEAYVDAEGAAGKDALRARAGGFIPQLSWEHPGTAWSTRYSLTPSPIGSWVSEEVRTFGAEAVWERELPAELRSRLTFGGFAGGDQIGRLLWERGWAMHDHQGDFAAKFHVPSGTIRPFQERDGRLGYYWRADILASELLHLGGGYWTNNGHYGPGAAGSPPGSPFGLGPASSHNLTTLTPGQVDPATQVWRTYLYHLGGKLEWRRFTFISQYMKVTAAAISSPPGDWSAAFAMGSYRWKKWRASARYDRFWSLNVDRGNAATLFAAYDLDMRQQLGLEFLYAGARPAQPVAPRAMVERQLQLNYRLTF